MSRNALPPRPIAGEGPSRDALRPSILQRKPPQEERMPSTPRLLDRSRNHLAETRLSYPGHLAIAFGIGGRLVLAGLACLCHGLVPGLFTDTASRAIRRLHAGLDGRAGPVHAAPPGRAAEAEA
jgi:Family of unknown function (DUF6356)